MRDEILHDIDLIFPIGVNTLYCSGKFSIIDNQISTLIIVETQHLCTYFYNEIGRTRNHDQYIVVCLMFFNDMLSITADERIDIVLDIFFRHMFNEFDIFSFQVELISFEYPVPATFTIVYDTLNETRQVGPGQYTVLDKMFDKHPLGGRRGD